MAKKTHELLEKYSKYCPKCKKYQQGVWNVCGICKTTLVDGRRIYQRHRLIKILRNILVISLLVFATYGIQPAERKHYNNSIVFLVKGKFRDSKEEFLRAFLANPLYKSASSVFQSLKNKIATRKVIIEIK